MSHNRDLSAAAAQLGFHSSNIGIGSEAPRYPLDIHGGNLLVSGSAAGNLILEDRGVGDSSRPFHVVSSDGGKFVINRSNRNASGTTTSSVTSLTLSNGGNLGLGGQTSPASNIHIGDISSGYELKISANALQFNRSSNSYIDQLHDTGDILFRVTSSHTEALRITSAGRIGINDSAPNFHLDIDGNIGLREGQVLTWHDGNGNKAGDVYMDSSDNFVIRNTSSVTERLRIDANGRIGINGRAPSDYNNPDLLISGDNATLTIMGDGSTNNSSIAALKFRVAGTSTGDYTKAGIFVQRQDGLNDLDMIFAFRSSNDAAGVTLSDEKLRIDSDGRMGLGTNSPDSYDGEADNFVVASSDHTGITIASTGSNKRTNLYFADGTSGNERYRGAITYDHNSDYMMMRTTGTERVRILGSGFVNIGEGYLTNSNSRLHVGRSSGGTAAGESVIAATLGNDSSMVSALLTVKNAGNRGSQGHTSGSPLAKFEFNNGTAFEIDKYGRRTLQYQPGCKISIDANGQGGGNHAQTGRTILPFNSTAYGYNTGNHYNLTTHTWTCPLDGKYLVILSVNVIGDNIGYIYKNGSIHSAGEFRSNPTGVWEHMEVSAVVQCSANDTIQPYSQMSGSGNRKFNGGSGGSYWDTLSIYYLG